MFLPIGMKQDVADTDLHVFILCNNQNIHELIDID